MTASVDIGAPGQAASAAIAGVLLGGTGTFTIISGGSALALGKYNLTVRGGNNLNLRGLSLNDGNLTL